MTAQAPTVNPALLAGLFTGIKGAKATLDKDYVRPGHYWLRIDNCKVDVNRKQVAFAAIEMTVVKVLDDVNGTGHRIGNPVSFYIARTSEYFLAEIKSFVSNIMDMRVEEVEEKHAMMVFGADQPLNGYVVELVARSVAGKTGKLFTKISWKREVPAAEVLLGIPADVKEMLFPNSILEKLAGQAA